jgi:hypothetical protein
MPTLSRPKPLCRGFFFARHGPFSTGILNMRNRLRVDALSAWRIEDTARRENRTFPEALAALVDSGYRNRRPSMPDHDPVVATDLTDTAVARASTVSFHAKPTTIAGIKRVAQIEDRSVSSAVEMLLRSALRQRGLIALATATTT